MITHHLIAILLGNVPLTPAQAAAQASLAGLVPAGHVQPKKLPQQTSQDGSGNALTLTQRSGGHVKTLTGREGTAKALYDVVCYGFDTPTADKIFQHVGELLDAYSGTVTVQGDTVKILGIFQQDSDDNGWLAAVNADEVGRHYAGGSFLVWHTEQT